MAVLLGRSEGSAPASECEGAHGEICLGRGGLGDSANVSVLLNLSLSLDSPLCSRLFGFLRLHEDGARTKALLLKVRGLGWGRRQPTREPPSRVCVRVWICVGACVSVLESCGIKPSPRDREVRHRADYPLPRQALGREPLGSSFLRPAGIESFRWPLSGFYLKSRVEGVAPIISIYLNGKIGQYLIRTGCGRGKNWIELNR